MTTLDPILYANGALRLTRHGAGKGGTVLMHVPSGKQFSVSERLAHYAERRVALNDSLGMTPEANFDNVHRDYGQHQAPGFYHD